MRTKATIRFIHRLFLTLIAGFMFTACGGGGSGDSGSSASLSGTAATGAPVDGIVYVTGSNGIETNAPVNSDGSFSIPLEGQTPPYMLRVVPNGAGDVLYSFASEADITVNITPLTTLALYMSSNSDLATLYNTWTANSAALVDSSIEAQQEIINANLTTLFGNNSVDASFYDFMHVGFNTDGTGIDGVLDALDVSIDYTGNTYSVLVNGTPLTWNQAVDTSNINLGDFAIAENSSWELTIFDSANNIDLTQIVTGLSVPNDHDQFESLSESELNGQFAFQGLQINFNIANITYDVLGTGEIGTTVNGTMAGTVRINGVFDGQAVDETVNLNTIFAWDRLS